MGVKLGSHWGKMCPIFLEFASGPPLIFHNFGAQKNVLQSFGSGRDPPPLLENFQKKTAFLWIASLRWPSIIIGSSSIILPTY